MRFLLRIAYREKRCSLWVLILVVFSSIAVFPLYAAGKTDAPKKTDTWGIDTDFSELTQAYSEFDNTIFSDFGNAYFKVAKNKVSYKSDITREISIDSVLSRFVEFHATYPLVESIAQQTINQFIQTQISTFKNEAQNSLKTHQCYFRELPCKDEKNVPFAYNSYITGKAWHSPSHIILTVYFVVEQSTGNTFSGKNTVMLFNATNGNTLSYEDIFTDPNKALDVIATLSVEKLQLQMDEIPTKNSHWLDGTVPLWKNYRSMAFDDEGNLLVFFDKYQVAPGFKGRVEVRIDLQDIEHLLKIKP